MKKVACFFNGPALGGAERSFALQCKLLKEKSENIDLNIYIPFFKNIDEANSLKDFLLECGLRNSEIFYYQYSPTLYGVSRSRGLANIFKFAQMIFGLIVTIHYLHQLKIKEKDTWWVGGNKVGFVVFLLGLLNGFKGRFLWHFRDYPFAQGIFRLLPFLFNLPHRFELEACGNSYDVKKAIESSPYQFKKTYALYNPIEKFSFKQQREDQLILGTASMLAPWKGVHSMVFFALMYERQLRELGFKNFYVYGENIYHTQGEHTDYKKSLIQLCKKFKSDFVIFKGLKRPQEVFENLDVFLHSSLKKEPFGRVIVEAYQAGSLVLSTNLGGASELIEPGESALTFLPYDYEGLFNELKQATSERRFQILQKANRKAGELEELSLKQLSEVFSLNLI